MKMPVSNSSKPSGRKKRRAAVMAAVLVCLLIVMLLGAAVLQNLILRNRQTRLDVMQLQAIWLAESAVDRAVSKLRMDGEYRGETWRVAMGENEETVGVVQIGVANVPDRPEQRLLLVDARYPEHEINRATHLNELIISLPTLGDSP